MNMQLAEVQLRGVTKNDLQEIYENTARELKGRLFFLDASYLYTFHLDDFVEVKHFNLLGRHYANKLKELQVDPNATEKQLLIAMADNSKYCRTWHECLELWYDDKWVILGGRRFKPIKISRTLDRVVNQGMGVLADFICGVGTAKAFDCRAIGDGDVGLVNLADKDLAHTVDIINVNETAEGGSLSSDGTTIYSVGNHSKETETPDNNEFTECAVFDEITTSKRCLDHSKFDDPIPHEQNVDAPGSTTVIYMCSG